LIFGVFSVRRKKDDECFGYPQAHQDTSSTPFFCSNSVEDSKFFEDKKQIEIANNHHPPTQFMTTQHPIQWRNDTTSDPLKLVPPLAFAGRCLAM